MPGVVSIRRLDLDHVGTLVAKDHRRKRAGYYRGEIKNTNAIKWTGHVRLLLSCRPHLGSEEASYQSSKNQPVLNLIQVFALACDSSQARTFFAGPVSSVFLHQTT